MCNLMCLVINILHLAIKSSTVAAFTFVNPSGYAISDSTVDLSSLSSSGMVTGNSILVALEARDELRDDRTSARSDSF